MKKVYLLMAMAVFALTSVAANLQQQKFELAPGAKETIQQRLEDFNTKVLMNDASVITRSSTDANGNVWEGRFLNYGPEWYKMFVVDGVQATWDDLPWYQVAALVYRTDAQGNTIDWYQGLLVYPADSIFDEELLPEEESEPLPIEELEVSGWNKFEVLPAGYVTYADEGVWGIINGEWLGVTCMFNQTMGYISEGSRLTVSGYNKEASEIGMMWQGTWIEQGATTASGSFATDFKGEAFITGFETATFAGDFTKLHMFDYGQVDWDTYPGDLYEVDFEPVRLYKTLAHNANIEINYGEDGYPAGFLFLDESFTQKDASYIMGSAYANLNSTTPVGLEFTVQDMIYNYDYDSYDNTPLENTLIPGGYGVAFSQYDGFELIYRGNSYLPISGSKLSIKENSFTYDGLDTYGNSWVMSFPELVLHLDSSDFTKTETLTSGINRLFGDKTVDLVTKSANCVNVTAAENGVIYVYSTTGALVKTVNAVAGEKVSIELGNGLYIVKVGKTAAKVIL